ncbi:sulfatase family protein [Spongiivirga citrea]|uniref:Sulfatase-like hydrolase/transferase n=1 Tax=Spongiivirga citrea TaxID=1481457 RepID=A0A6M0CJ54_9FLAO|nr:sulfatase [Spongiivirga citrea]NER17861.1 sulfatase-like hydrolase/transferase [Spongiivirga citrea]
MDCNYKLIIALFFIVTNSVLGQERPNILWITIEDTSPQFIGAYGNTEARTPVIDQLSKEGVRFTNAFSTGTVCSPSRSAIITGARTYEMGTGHHRSAFPIPDYIHGFPYYMKKQGYYVTNNRKTDYNVANVKEFTQETWHESSNRAGWWGRKGSEPFFAVFNFAESHQSRTMTNSYEWYLKHVLEHLPKENQIAEDAFTMPPFYRDSPQMRKQFARVYNSIKLTDLRIGKLLQRLEKDNLRQNTIIIFYADHGEGIPRGKTNGINLGYRVPFIIWFPEKFKHLSPWGTGGVVSDELITFEDLAPSMVSLVGGRVPDYMNGRILMGNKRNTPTDYVILSSDRADNGNDLVRSITDGTYMYSRNYMPFVPEMRYLNYVEIAEITQQMRDDLQNDLLNPLQRKLFSPRSPEVLFNIEEDIWETNNLIDSKGTRKILKTMRTQLDEKLIKSHDIHFLPEYEIEKISKNTTPYEYRMGAEYPFKQIYSAASISGKKGESVIQKQIELLSSKNKIVRYWASMGLMSQEKGLLDKYQTQLINFLEDDYEPVSINMATILFQKYNDVIAKKKLIAYCKSKDSHLVLMTINNLLYVDYKEPFIETVQFVNALTTHKRFVKDACKDFLHITGVTNY